MTDANTIIVRQSSNDFDAFRTANAMQGMEGVDVISVVCQPVAPRWIDDRGERWHVYAKYADDTVTTDDIDNAIDRAISVKPVEVTA